MKKFLLLTGMLLSLGLFWACSSDDDITDVIEGQTTTESTGNENDEGKDSEAADDSDVDSLANKVLYGTWELREFDEGWLQWVTYNPNEVVCHIYDNDIITVINSTNIVFNNTDIASSPFMNSGSYSFQLYTKCTEMDILSGKGEPQDYISINGIEFGYYIFTAEEIRTLHTVYGETEDVRRLQKYGNDVLQLSRNYECDGQLYRFVRIK